MISDIAKKYTGLGLSLGELIKAGEKGEQIARASWQPEKGSFRPWAIFWIKKSITDAISGRQSIDVEIFQAGCMVRSQKFNLRI